MGLGNMLGDLMLMGWKIMNPYERFVSDFINLWVNVRDDRFLERSKQFQTWYEYTQNIWAGGTFRRWKSSSRRTCIEGTLRVLKRQVDLGVISCRWPCWRVRRTTSPGAPALQHELVHTDAPGACLPDRG
jgi:hypothetical protein